MTWHNFEKFGNHLGFRIELDSTKRSIESLWNFNVNFDVFEFSTRTARMSVKNLSDYLENRCTHDLIYASFQLINYQELSVRLRIEKNISATFFWWFWEKIKLKSLWPKMFAKKVVYVKQNSPSGGKRLSFVRTAKQFRMQFYYSGFSKILNNFITSCLSCSNFNRVTRKQQHALQSFFSDQHFSEIWFKVDFLDHSKW